jgi:hypothetical protein
MKPSVFGFVTGLSTCCAMLGVVHAAHAVDDPPAALLTWSVDEGESMVMIASGVVHATSGNQVYSYDWTAPDGSWKAIASYSVDWKTNPTVKIAGYVQIKNLGQETRVFHCGIDVPICPTIGSGSLFGGASSLTLTAVGADGLITCAPPAADGTPWLALMRLTANGDPMGSLFNCPFNMATDDSGNATTNWFIGTPIPSGIGPQSIESIGAIQNFQLSGGDSAQFSFGMTVKDWPANDQSTCVGDISGDGNVDGADLGAVLGYWGQPVGCFDPARAADLNNDGTIDAIDLATMLGAWGACNP